jgi:aromatic amino acid aminotransferase I
MAPPSAVDVVGLSDTSSVVVIDPLTANGIAAQRAKGAKIPTTVAAVSNSDAFKSPVSIDVKACKQCADRTLE